MNIGEVHALVVEARRLENETAVAAETIASSVGDDSRAVLDAIARGARIRQVLWDSRLPDTSYISTGRATVIVAPTETASPPSDLAGLTSHLVRLRDLYAEALPHVTAALDPMTHRLLERGRDDISSALADLAG